MGKSLTYYCTLGLAISKGQDNEHHVKFTSKDGYSFGFMPETTMLHTNPNWQAPTGDDRISLQFAFKTPAEVDETYKKLKDAGHQSLKEPWDAFR